MRITLVFLFIALQCQLWAQARPSGYNAREHQRKFPFTRGYQPRFVGLVAGYNFVQSQDVELGVCVNVNSGLTDFGMTGGYQLSYRRSLNRDLNSIEAEMGAYGLVTVGMGVNYNFNNELSTVGVKPIIGTSIWHFQFIYGYNFLLSKQVKLFDLPQHSLRIRYVIPIIASKKTKYYPPSAPNYNYLPGLHKEHPLKREEQIRNNIQLR